MPWRQTCLAAAHDLSFLFALCCIALHCIATQFPPPAHWVGRASSSSSECGARSCVLSLLLLLLLPLVLLLLVRVGVRKRFHPYTRALPLPSPPFDWPARAVGHAALVQPPPPPHTQLGSYRCTTAVAIFMMAGFRLSAPPPGWEHARCFPFENPAWLSSGMGGFEWAGCSTLEPNQARTHNAINVTAVRCVPSACPNRVSRVSVRWPGWLVEELREGRHAALSLPPSLAPYPIRVACIPGRLRERRRASGCPRRCSYGWSKGLIGCTYDLHAQVFLFILQIRSNYGIQTQGDCQPATATGTGTLQRSPLSLFRPSLLSSVRIYMVSVTRFLWTAVQYHSTVTSMCSAATSRC